MKEWNGSLRTAKRGLSLLIALFMLFGLVGSVAKADVGAGYYLVSTMNGWAVNEAYQLTKNNEASVTEYWITLDLEAGAEFKAVHSADGTAASTWYPGGENYKITEETGE